MIRRSFVLDGRTAYLEPQDDVHWVVETKADREADRPEMRARRHAADEWAAS